MRDQYSPSRLNLDYVSNPIFNDFPTANIIRSLASGVVPITDPSFIADTSKAKLRIKMITLQPALNALTAILQKRGEALVITREAFLKSLHVHKLTGFLSEIHHTHKQDDDLGRLLFDYSNITDTCPINSDNVRDRCTEYFGQIKHPSFAMFLSIYFDSKSSFPGEKILIHKSDVARAYHRIQWTSEGSLLMAVLLSADLVIIPLTLGFGPTLAPFAYGPVTEFNRHFHLSLLRRINASLKPLQDIYTDDAITFAPNRIINIISRPTDEHNRAMLGTDSVNSSKDRCSERENVIGFLTDTSKEIASPSYRSFLKLIYVFFVVLPMQINIGMSIPIKVIQCVGSLSSRYCKTILAVTHCSFGFYSLTRQNQFAHLKLMKRQVECINLWRNILYSSFFDFKILTAPFRTVLYNDKHFTQFAANCTKFHVFSDAATEPEGCIGVVVPTLGWISWVWPGPETGIATLEFLAHLVAYCFAIYLIPNCPHVHLWIDNKNALAWSSGRIRTDSNFAINLTVFNSFLQNAYRHCTQTRDFIPTSQNILADAASRLQFLPLQGLPRFALTPTFTNFLLTLSSLLPKDQSEIAHMSHTIPLSESFQIFSRSSDLH